MYKEGDANTVQVAQRIDQRVEAIRASLPEDIELVEIYDQSTFIASAVNDVRTAAVLGGLIAILVLYGFLRDSRATTIVGIAIPVSVIGTFLLMYTNDISLNIMSLGGIALAVGMLVDNSIVVLENIVRKKEQGQDIVEAAKNGTTEVGSAVVAATLTTIAVFFPMVFISGIAGQLFRDKALTVTFALGFSLLVALTLIPMLASLGARSRYDDGGDGKPAGVITRAVAFVVRLFGLVFLGVRKLFWILLWVPTWLLQRLYSAVAAVYPGMLRWSLEHRGLVVAAAAVIFARTMSLVPRLGTELIPQFSQGEFSVDLRLAPGAPLAETDRAIQATQRAAAGIDDVELDYSVAGSGNRLDANPVDAGDNTGTLNITLKSGSGRDAENRTMDAMRAELARLPGVQYEFARPALLSFASPLQIEISGYDLDSLARMSQLVVASLSTSDRFTDIKTTVERGNQPAWRGERARNRSQMARSFRAIASPSSIPLAWLTTTSGVGISVPVRPPNWSSALISP